ncbi:MAG TPA: hypothetical protein DGT23_12035 [Micromonosporaceae bacterium]|nr:hypothetical protein [Micromonosporaceae bacterium]
MKVYAERPWRLTRQIVADLALAVWCLLWIWAAVGLYHFVQKLAVPGQKLESSGDRLAADLADAEAKAGAVPLIGKTVASPFGRAADAARGIAEAGRDQQSAVGDLATVVGWFTAGVPILIALALWIPFRAMWIRTATAAVKIRRRQGGSELLALRALATAPLRRLTDLDDDVVAGWRDGDPEMVDCLARMELRRLGLRPAAS